AAHFDGLIRLADLQRDVQDCLLPRGQRKRIQLVGGESRRLRGDAVRAGNEIIDQPNTVLIGDGGEGDTSSRVSDGDFYSWHHGTGGIAHDPGNRGLESLCKCGGGRKRQSENSRDYPQNAPVRWTRTCCFHFRSPFWKERIYLQVPRENAFRYSYPV